MSLEELKYDPLAAPKAEAATSTGINHRPTAPRVTSPNGCRTGQNGLVTFLHYGYHAIQNGCPKHTTVNCTYKVTTNNNNNKKKSTIL